jgi:hypothetical protein
MWLTLCDGTEVRKEMRDQTDMLVMEHVLLSLGLLLACTANKQSRENYRGGDYTLPGPLRFLWGSVHGFAQIISPSLNAQKYTIKPMTW